MAFYGSREAHCRPARSTDLQVRRRPNAGARCRATALGADEAGFPCGRASFGQWRRSQLFLPAQPFEQLRQAPAGNALAEPQWLGKVAAAAHAPELGPRDLEIGDDLSLIEQRIIGLIGLVVSY